MGAIFYIKQGDTKPSLYVNLVQDGSVVNLEEAAVMFHMGDKVDGTVEVVSATLGAIRYNWAEGDTDVPGCYPAEFEVTFSDETIETFPNDDYLTIIILKELA